VSPLRLTLPALLFSELMTFSTTSMLQSFGNILSMNMFICFVLIVVVLVTSPPTVCPLHTLWQHFLFPPTLTAPLSPEDVVMAFDDSHQPADDDQSAPPVWIHVRQCGRHPRQPSNSTSRTRDASCVDLTQSPEASPCASSHAGPPTLLAGASHALQHSSSSARASR